MMAFTVENTKSLLEHYLVTELEKSTEKLIVKIKEFIYFSQSELYEHLTVIKTVRRDLLAELVIPDCCGGKIIALKLKKKT